MNQYFVLNPMQRAGLHDNTAALCLAAKAPAVLLIDRMATPETRLSTRSCDVSVTFGGGTN